LTDFEALGTSFAASNVIDCAAACVAPFTAPLKGDADKAAARFNAFKYSERQKTCL